MTDDFLMPLISRYSLILSVLCAALLLGAAGFSGCLQVSTPPPPSAAAVQPASETIPVQTVYQKGEIPRLCADAERQANASLNVIASIRPDQRNFDNTFLAFDRVISDYTDATSPLIKIGILTPDPSVAEESLACRQSSSVFTSGIISRRDLYEALRGQTARNAEESRLYRITIRDFEKNGLRYDDDRLSRIRALRANLTATELAYISNLNNDNTTMVLTRDELAGLSAEDLASLEAAGNGTYRISFRGPDVSMVLTKADRPDVRRRVYAADINIQADQNTALLEQAILLRQQLARELGYGSWADYQLDGRSAKNTSTVMAFLDSLKDPLREKSRAERAELLVIKKGIDPGATTVDPWDLGYLMEKQTRIKYAYSTDELKEYFPLDTVADGVFSIYGSLYGIRFDELRDVPTWAPDVRVYRVANVTTNATVGFLFLDPYPREGKGPGYSETALRGGRMKDGTYSAPVVMISGNFPPPEAGKPSLLEISEAGTLLHETGHAMHEILTRVPYGTLSGTRVAWDFVETPSQTMEEWAWDPQVMESLSGRYTNRSEKIPQVLRDKVIASRDAGTGLMYSAQLANALEDMRFHTAEGPVNVTSVYLDTYREIRGMEPLADAHQPAQFDHLVDGYDAGFYGYLWSKVYALEVAGEFEKDGMRNSTTGARFRQDILEKGDMADGTVLLEKFLGREPGAGALYARLGINATRTAG